MIKNYGQLLNTQAYREKDRSPTNPYRKLEKSTHFGFVHDATSHWVKELNTVFIRAVDETGEIFKVLYVDEINNKHHILFNNES